MIDISIDAKPIEDFLEKAQEQLEPSKIVFAVGDATSRYMSELAVNRRLVGATGDLVRKIKSYKVNSNTVEVYSNVPYNLFVETGTRPHKVNPAFLFAWARKKLGNAFLAYPIAKIIEKRGTQAKYYVRDTADWLKSVIDNTLFKIIEKIGK